LHMLRFMMSQRILLCRVAAAIPMTPSKLSSIVASLLSRETSKVLRELRRQHHTTILVDAFCINLNGEKEKGHQILRMRDIHSKVAETIVWLTLIEMGMMSCEFSHATLQAS
jgi:hypothetical protein